MSEAAVVTPSATPAGAPPNAAPAVTPAPVAAAPTGDWTKGLSEDMRGFVANKGFTGPEMVLESYVNLEKLRGVPAERLLKIPEKMDDPAWATEIYPKLGRPATAKEYKITMPEKGGDEAFAGKAKDWFFDAGLSQSQGEKLSAKWNEHVASVVEEQKSVQQAKDVQERSALKKEWGLAFEENINKSVNAAKQFGINDETLKKMGDAVGYATVAKMMHSIGSKIAEDGFISGAKGSSFGSAMTPEAARHKINSLRADPDFVKRYTRGEGPAIEEMGRLHQFAYPDEAAG